MYAAWTLPLKATVQIESVLQRFLRLCKYGIIEVNNEKMNMCTASSANCWSEVDKQNAWHGNEQTHCKVEQVW